MPVGSFAGFTKKHEIPLRPPKGLRPVHKAVTDFISLIGVTKECKGLDPLRHGRVNLKDEDAACE
ncbi:hypothetical protein D3C80_1729560 [compost metagenome]